MGVRLGQNNIQQQVKTTVKNSGCAKEAGSAQNVGNAQNTGSAANAQKPTVTYTPGNANFGGKPLTADAQSLDGAKSDVPSYYSIGEASAFIDHWRKLKEQADSSTTGSGESAAMKQCREAFEQDLKEYHFWLSFGISKLQDMLEQNKEKLENLKKIPEDERTDDDKDKIPRLEELMWRIPLAISYRQMVLDETANLRFEDL